MLLRSEHLDELLAMQPTAEIDSAMADLAEALLRGVTETVAAEVPRKLGTIVHKSIPTLIQAVDLYREVEGQLSISSRNFLLHSLRSIILMLQADDDLDKLSQAINDDAKSDLTTGSSLASQRKRALMTMTTSLSRPPQQQPGPHSSSRAEVAKMVAAVQRSMKTDGRMLQMTWIRPSTCLTIHPLPGTRLKPHPATLSASFRPAFPSSISTATGS